MPARNQVFRLVSAAAFVLAVGVAPAQVFNGFESFDELDDFEVHTSGFGLLSQTSNGGVGGSGRLRPGSTHALTYNAQSFDLSEPATVSTMFKLELAGGFFSSPLDLVSVYLTSEPDGRPGGPSSLLGVARVQRYLSSGTDFLDQYVSLPGQLFLSTSLPLGTQLDFDRWYRLEYEFTPGPTPVARAAIVDLGLTGSDFPAVVAQFNSIELGAGETLQAAGTLYGGFGAGGPTVGSVDNFAIDAAFGDPGVATAIVEPAFDVAHKLFDPPRFVDGETSLTIGGLPGSATFPVQEPVLEFPLDGLPAGASIESATLVLNTFASSGSPRVRATGYAGDGLASIADATRDGPVLATTGPMGASVEPVEIALDPVYVESLLGGASHLGLRLSSLDDFDYVGFSSTELTQDADAQPFLRLAYRVGPLAGDYNLDGVVTLADYTVWRDGLNTAYGAGDYQVWVDNFGQGGVADANAVPEPTAAWLLLAGVVAAASRYRRV